MRRILAPLTRRATSFHTCCSHLPGDLPKGLQNDGIGGFGMRTRLWRAAKGGSRAPTRPLDRSNLNFDDRETFFGSDLLAAHCWRRVAEDRSRSVAHTAIQRDEIVHASFRRALRALPAVADIAW